MAESHSEASLFAVPLFHVNCLACLTPRLSADPLCHHIGSSILEFVQLERVPRLQMFQTKADASVNHSKFVKRDISRAREFLISSAPDFQVQVVDHEIPGWLGLGDYTLGESSLAVARMRI